MAESRSRLDEIFAKLKQERDELSLKIHLGRKEAAEEWEKLEVRFSELRAKSAPIRGVASETAKEVGTALELAAEEIKKGYERIRKLL